MQRRPGRPRSTQTRRRILFAAITELEERGYRDLTIEGIAARAGAGKQTIYRWWGSKADVVLDALLELSVKTATEPDTGSLLGDLDVFLAATFRQRGQRAILNGLMAQALVDLAFRDAFRERFLFVGRTALNGLLERALYRGEITPEVDVDLLLDVVFGVFWYRLMLDHAPLDEGAGRELAAFIVRAVE